MYKRKKKKKALNQEEKKKHRKEERGKGVGSFGNYDKFFYFIYLAKLKTKLTN